MDTLSLLESGLKPVRLVLWLIITYSHKAYCCLQIIKSFKLHSSSDVSDIALLATLSTYTKLPNHLAFVVHRCQATHLKKIAKAISWAWVLDIPFVSVYDVEGILKSHAAELHTLVISDIERALLELRKSGVGERKLPLIKFVHHTFENECEGNSTFKVSLLSWVDCKNGIVTVSKALFEKRLSTRRKSSLSGAFVNKALDFVTWETELNKLVGLDWSDMEPELMMVFGNINSTLGFLPWHVRLTEIHWLPPIQQATCLDFFNSLKEFSGCERRVGK